MQAQGDGGGVQPGPVDLDVPRHERYSASGREERHRAVQQDLPADDHGVGHDADEQGGDIPDPRSVEPGRPIGYVSQTVPMPKAAASRRPPSVRDAPRPYCSDSSDWNSSGWARNTGKNGRRAGSWASAARLTRVDRLVAVDAEGIDRPQPQHQRRDGDHDRPPDVPLRGPSAQRGQQRAHRAARCRLLPPSARPGHVRPGPGHPPGSNRPPVSSSCSGALPRMTDVRIGAACVPQWQVPVPESEYGVLGSATKLQS